MKSSAKILAALRSNLGDEYVVETAKPASRKDVAKVNKALGVELPKAYVDFICGPDRIVVRRVKTDEEYFKFLDPLESLALIQREVELFDEHSFGDEEDDIAYAHAEAKVRQRMYPFQFMSTYVYNFYCFYLDDCVKKKMRIEAIYHDDFELSMGDPKPADAEYSFLSHLETWVQNVLDE